MKVIEVTGQHLLSGIGRYGWELSNGIHKKGMLDMFYKPFKKNHPDSIYHGQPWVKKIHYRSFRNLHPYLLPFFIRSAIKTNSADIVHAHWFLSGLAISTIKRANKIITMHDVSLLHLPEQESSYIDYYRWAINRFKRLEIPIIVVSNQAKLDTIKYANYPEHLIHVVYNGINHSQFFPDNNQEKRPKDTFRFVYSGGLGKRKNVGLLLRAFALVQQKFPYVELVISGAHPERTEYPSMKEELGLKNVRFTGFIDDNEMADFYRSGHCMVFPSQYEGFGLAPLESMASGTPVLCAKGGALEETSGEGALFFEYDSHDVAAKMEKVMLDETYREQLTQNGIQQASKFTWNQTVDRTLEIYRTLD